MLILPQNVYLLREFSILRTDKCYILLLLLAYLLSQWTDPSRVWPVTMAAGSV